MRAFAAQHLPGRIGQPEGAGYTVHYLASDEAAFVAGSALMVDGGLTIAERNPA